MWVCINFQSETKYNKIENEMLLYLYYTVYKNKFQYYSVIVKGFLRVIIYQNVCLIYNINNCFIDSYNTDNIKAS